MYGNTEYQECLDNVKEAGYDSVREYVQCMAEDYGVPIDIARSLFNMLGYSEAFDGFVNALEDYNNE